MAAKGGAGGTAHGVPLNTLKDCFRFLMGLHGPSGRAKLNEVAVELEKRLKTSYNNALTAQQIYDALSKLLGNVDTFYKKLVKAHVAQNTYNVSGHTPEKLLQALLECLPKFLAAIYYLWYHVDVRFEAVGGGKWKDLYPGWEKTWWHFGYPESGGQLQDYLRVHFSVSYDVITGGFDEEEVTYGYKDAYHTGYPFGGSMVKDLEHIFSTKSGHNFYRDVFVTSVLSDAGTAKFNTANVLRLVRMFCRLVKTDNGSKKLEAFIKPESKCLKWDDLKKHCSALDKQLESFFKNDAFSLIGQASTANGLNAENFAKTTAEWFRKYLPAVRNNVTEIGTRYPTDGSTWLDTLHPFVIRNLIPYGFIFGDNSYGTMGDAWKILPQKWNNTISMLKKANDGLEKLRQLLEGEGCKPPPDPPQPPQASGSVAPTGSGARGGGGRRGEKQGRGTPSGVRGRDASARGPSGAARSNPRQVQSSQHTRTTGDRGQTRRSGQPASPVTKAAAAKTTTAKTEATKTEAAKPITKTEATSPQGGKAEGTPSQAEKVESSQNQNNGQSGGKPSNSSVVTSASSLPPGGAGAPGKAGGQGDQGQKGSSSTKSTTPPSQKTVHQQPLPPPQPAPTSPATPPKTPAAPGSPNQPSSGGAPGQTAGGSPSSVQPPTTGGTSHVAPSSGASGSSGGQGKSGQAGPSDSVPTGGNGRGSTAGGYTVQQPAAASQSVTTQSTSGTSSSPQSTGSSGGKVSSPGGGQPGGNGLGGQGSGSKGTQPVVTSQNVITQLESAKSTDPQSPVVPAPGNGQGTGVQGSTSSTTQRSGQGIPQSSANATTATSAGPVAAPGGSGGGGGGSNGKGDQKSVDNHVQQCPSHMRSERKGTATYCHPSITLTRRPDFKVSNPDEVWNAIQSKTLPSYITTPANNHTTPQYKTVSTSVNHPNHTTQESFHLPTGGRNRHGKPYYVPADGRPRKGVMGIRDVPSLDFDGESIPDKSLKRVQQEMRKNGEMGKKRVAVKVRAKHDQALRDVQDRWNKDAEKIKTEDKEWRKRQEAGKLLKQSDDYAIVQQERKRAAAEALQKKLDDHRIAQEEELKKIQSAPSVYLDGSQPIYQYPYVINNHQDDFLSMYSVDGGVIPDPYKDRNDSERKRKSDDALHDILTEKQLQLALNLETEQKFKDARDVELQKFLHHVQDKSTAAEGLVSGKIVTPSQPESYKYQAFTVADGTPIVDKRHLHDDIGKLQRKSAGDDWNDYVQRRKESLDKEAKLHRDEVAKKNSDAIEAIKSMGIPQVITEHAPRRPSPILYELPHFDIQVAKDTLPENNLDFDLDFDDDSTHIKNETPTDFVDSSFPAISFNLPPPDPEQSLPPPEDFSPDIISRPDLKMCTAPWMTQAEIGDSTDIHETDLFPAEAPRTVRDMLQWLAGLKNPKHHKTLKQCIEKAFGGLQDDPSQLAIFINHAKIRPGDVFDILQLTAMFAGSVLSAIAPNWKANVSSRTVQLKSSDEPDCCTLLCQLRDYAYACHHQLQFLKSQCNRDVKHGGWQNCNYGSDITSPNSPLQSFLTDGWDSTFKTHPFDPCNLCLKSRIRMGFKREDLPKNTQMGSVISTILSPSCGGSDPLLTLSSYLNCLTRRTPRTTGELVSYFHNFGNELHDYAFNSLSKLGLLLCKPHNLMFNLLPCVVELRLSLSGMFDYWLHVFAWCNHTIVT